MIKFETVEWADDVAVDEDGMISLVGIMHDLEGDQFKIEGDADGAVYIDTTKINYVALSPATLDSISRFSSAMRAKCKAWRKSPDGQKWAALYANEPEGTSL